MGMCCSKNRFRLGFLRSRSNRPPHISLLSPEFVASAEAPTSWHTEPRLYLRNSSGYRVSFWVIQEDKKRTRAHRERIASSVGLHLNLGINAGGKLSGGAKREKEETIETEVLGVYFLMRDHRMGPNGITQPTQVPFPANCQEVRVYGFFEEEGEGGGGQWRPYKDKVYSIGRGKKSFVLNALDSNIAPFVNKKAGAATNRRE